MIRRDCRGGRLDLTPDGVRAALWRERGGRKEFSSGFTTDWPGQGDSFRRWDGQASFVMLALWLEKQKLSLRNDIPIPDPPKGKALVRVRLAGICGTDLELAKGYYPFCGIIGHEFVGEILSCPSSAEREGERVVGEINASCGRCELCLSGRSKHCPTRTVLGIVNRNGAFAEYLVLPESNLIPVNAGVSDEVAVYAEPLAAALRIQEQVNIRRQDRVLVIGAGRLGQLIAQTLALTGSDFKVVSRHAKQSRILAEFGIRCVTEDAFPRGQWDVVVEATGSPSGFSHALQAVRPRGTIVLKSTYHGTSRVDFSRIVVDEVTLVGSRCGPFPPALELLEQGKVDPLPLTDATYSLSSALDAVHRARRPGALKVLLKNAD